jgi:hypothetical protein
MENVMKRLLLGMLSAVFALAIGLPVSGAQAAGYFVNMTYTGSNTCSTGIAAIGLSKAWNVPSGETETSTERFNGAIVSGPATFSPPLSGNFPGQSATSMPLAIVPPSAYTYTWTWAWAGGVNKTFSFTLHCYPPYASKGTVTVSGVGTGVPLPFMDGRCNQEAWQSFAVYPDNKGGFVFYAIYKGVGYYAMHVTEKDLDNNPDTGVNHIIAQAVGVQLWRLVGGALQATRIGMDGKPYSFNITCGLMEDGD